MSQKELRENNGASHTHAHAHTRMCTHTHTHAHTYTENTIQSTYVVIGSSRRYTSILFHKRKYLTTAFYTST